ncbi:hypothetical protein ABK040_009703 [Willaertia magna]
MSFLKRLFQTISDSKASNILSEEEEDLSSTGSTNSVNNNYSNNGNFLVVNSSINSSTSTISTTSGSCIPIENYLQIPMKDWNNKLVLNFLIKEQFDNLINKIEKLKYNGMDLIKKKNLDFEKELNISIDEANELIYRINFIKKKQNFSECDLYNNNEDYNNEDSQLLKLQNNNNSINGNNNIINFNNNRNSVLINKLEEYKKELLKDLLNSSVTDLIKIKKNKIYKNKLIIVKDQNPLLELSIYNQLQLTNKEKEQLNKMKLKLNHLLKNNNFLINYLNNNTINGSNNEEDYNDNPLIEMTCQNLILNDRFKYIYLNPNRINKNKQLKLQNTLQHNTLQNTLHFIDINIAIIRNDYLNRYDIGLLIGTFLFIYSIELELIIVREVDFNFIDFIKLFTIYGLENIYNCFDCISKCCCSINLNSNSIIGNNNLQNNNLQNSLQNVNSINSSIKFISKMLTWIDFNNQELILNLINELNNLFIKNNFTNLEFYKLPIIDNYQYLQFKNYFKNKIEHFNEIIENKIFENNLINFNFNLNLINHFYKTFKDELNVLQKLFFLAFHKQFYVHNSGDILIEEWKDEIYLYFNENCNEYCNDKENDKENDGVEEESSEAYNYFPFVMDLPKRM